MVTRFYTIVAMLLLSLGGTTHAQDFSLEKAVASKTALTPAEMLAFTKSSIFTTLLSTAVGQLNQYPAILGPTRTLMQDGSDGAKVMGFPFVNGEFIFSREVMTGNFQAVDNLLHLADQFGIRINGGFNINTANLPIALHAGAQANISISRVFTHLKPIFSFKKANHYPFKNAFISFFLRNRAKDLEAVMDPRFPSLPLETKKEIYSRTMKTLLEGIEPGESLLITDSFSAEANVTAGGALYQAIDLSGNVRRKEITLRRTHIHRLDENTFQIFEDEGNAHQPGFGIQLGFKAKVIDWDIPHLLKSPNRIENAVLPIFRSKWGRNKGKAHTRLIQLHLASEPSDEAELMSSVADLGDLHEVLLNHDADSIETRHHSLVIENKFDEKNNQNRLPILSNKNLWSSSSLQIKNEDGTEQSFIREYFGKSSGINFSYSTSHGWSFLKELFLHSPSVYIEDNVVNPGYSANGMSKNHILSFEAELNPDGSKKEEFVTISGIENGWNLSAEKLQKRVDELNAEYADGTQATPILFGTNRLFLFSINLAIELNGKGIRYLSGLSEERIREIFKKHGIDLDHRLLDDRIEHNLEKFRETLSARHLLKAISIADRKLPAKGLIDLFGGSDHVSISIKIEGIHQPDENADAVLLSEKFPIAGSSRETGPLSRIQKRLRMSDGEFHALWIKGRIL